MALTWSGRRQLLYYAVGLLFATILLFVLWQAFLMRTPTCTDGIQNGGESGVDCGGACANICLGDARSPNILWARAFPAAPQTYTLVAYVENRTDGAAAKQVPYLLQLFDEKNELVIDREGFVDLPPVSTVPVVIPSLNVGNREVARTLFRFTAEPQWERVRADVLPQIRISGQQLAADGTRLSAQIHNDGFNEARGITVVGVIFDAEGIARAASVSYLDLIASKSSEPAVFTWRDSVANVARAEITVLPSF